MIGPASRTAHELLESSADAAVLLLYQRNVHTNRFEWYASINVRPVRRGTRKADRIVAAWGPSPESAMRALTAKLPRHG